MRIFRLLSVVCLTLAFNLAYFTLVLAEEQVAPNPVAEEKADLNALKSDEKTELLASASSALEQKDFISTETVRQDDEDVNPNELADPLYPLNYAMFFFNDKLQLWLFEPAATGYGYVTPEIVRVGFSNAFSNMRAPVNVVNNLLQFKVDRFGIELFRFIFNSVVGVGGFYDASYNLLGIDKHEADFSQTLGYYGLGQGIYIVWPFVGPSSLRETVGFAGDQLMSPPTYIGYFFLNFLQSNGVVAFEKINDTSFKLGDYALLVGASVDPYLALKNSFEQYRAKKVLEAQGR